MSSLSTENQILDVAPSRKNIGFFSLLFGFLLGIARSLYKEKKSGKVYRVEEIKKLLNIQIIEEININEINLETNKMDWLVP